MLQIDIYTEITCPWCFIGLHRLDKVLSERFPSLEVSIFHHPVVLLPDVPTTGLYIPDLLRKRYGVTDPKAAFTRPESEARASGLNLDLSHQPYAYPTQAAHALIEGAEERGTQHELAVAISDAYFLEAKDIGDADVLAAIAAGYGFSHDEARSMASDPARHRRVEDAAARSVAAGVKSVPHFVFGKMIVITGGRSEDEIASAIRSSASAPHFGMEIGGTVR